MTHKTWLPCLGNLLSSLHFTFKSPLSILYPRLLISASTNMPQTLLTVPLPASAFLPDVHYSNTPSLSLPLPFILPTYSSLNPQPPPACPELSSQLLFQQTPSSVPYILQTLHRSPSPSQLSASPLPFLGLCILTILRAVHLPALCRVTCLRRFKSLSEVRCQGRPAHNSTSILSQRMSQNIKERETDRY